MRIGDTEIKNFGCKKLPGVKIDSQQYTKF